MSQTRHRNGDSVGDSSHVPSYELIPLEGGAEPEAALFDFGPDLALPDGAPVAALPPWMAQDGGDPTLAQGEGGTRRSRRRAPAVPRARRHRRPDSVAEAEAVQRLADAARRAEEDTAVDTRDVDVAAVIAAEVSAERARRVRAGAGREVPAQPVVREGRYRSPIRALSSALPAQATPTQRARTQPVRSQPAERGRPTPPGSASESAVAAGPKPARGRNKVVAALLVAAAIGGGAAAWTLSAGARSSESNLALTGSAVAARDWVEENVGEKASVLAPASVAAGLRAVDFDPSRVIPYPDAPSAAVGAMPDWRCCNVLLATAAAGTDVRDAVPSALRNSYDRSRPMATFTGGGTVTEVRQVLDGSPAEVAKALDAERAARIVAGKEIVGLERIELSKAAASDLKAGRVDSRVMLALVGLSRQVEVRVLDFPSDAADRAAGAPARGMRIDRLGGKEISTDSAEAGKAYEFLDAQVAPYRPLNADLIDSRARAGSPVLEVVYDAPGPLGLVAPRGD